MFFANIIPGSDGFWSDKAVADILDDLSDGVDEEYLGGGLTGGSDHGDRIDDRDGVEKSLCENVPDRGDIAILDVDGAEEEWNAEGETVEFKEDDRDKEPSPGWSDTVDECEDYDYDEIDEQINNSGKSSGYNDDIFWKADFTDEFAASDDGLDTLASTFNKETPEGGASEEINWVMRDVIPKFK